MPVVFLVFEVNNLSFLNAIFSHWTFISFFLVVVTHIKLDIKFLWIIHFSQEKYEDILNCSIATTENLQLSSSSYQYSLAAWVKGPGHLWAPVCNLYLLAIALTFGLSSVQNSFTRPHLIQMSIRSHLSSHGILLWSPRLEHRKLELYRVPPSCGKYWFSIFKLWNI
jgi:hypothetical protein